MGLGSLISKLTLMSTELLVLITCRNGELGCCGVILLTGDY